MFFSGSIRLEEVVRHGTTTCIVGNCSIGAAYGSQRHKGEDPILDCFARVENIPKNILERCVEKMDWTDSAGYLEHLKTLPLGPNIAPLLPHSMIRIEVMGTKEAISRQPSFGNNGWFEHLNRLRPSQDSKNK